MVVERCINGKIDGLDDTTTTGSTQSQDVQTTHSPVTAIDPAQSTDIDVPEESETDFTATTEIDIPGETGTDSAQTTEADVPEQTETDLPDNTDTPPDVKTTTGGIVLPTWSTFRTWTWANTSFTAPPNAETTRIATSVDVLSSTDIDEESTTAAADQDTSTVEPTTTTAAETTTTTEAAVITNAVRNGRFAEGSSADIFDIPGFTNDDYVQRVEGSCYQDDGSPDNACVSFSLSEPGAPRKRAAPSSRSRTITQQLTGLTPLDTYTVQFYYFIESLDEGSGASCTITSKAGMFDVYGEDLLESNAGVWQRAIGTVTGDNDEAPLSITIECPTDASIVVLVDSLFITNEATEDSINQFELDYGQAEPEP